MLRQGLLVGFHLVGHAEELKDILVRLEADGAQEGSYREFLLPVDIRVHHVIDVRGEFHPRALEGDHAGGVDLGAVRVERLPEEYPRGTVQLGYHHAFGTVDHESAAGGHVGDIAQEYVLDDGLEIDVLLVVTAQAQFGFEGNGIGEPALHTLFDGIAGRIDEIVQELQYENVAGVRDRKVLLEHLEETLVVAFIGGGFQLEIVLERLDLDLQEVGCFCEVFNLAKIHSAGRSHFC
jgi:hypothetical protein